jgi:hypothetical protein
MKCVAQILSDCHTSEKTGFGYAWVMGKWLFSVCVVRLFPLSMVSVIFQETVDGVVDALLSLDLTNSGMLYKIGNGNSDFLQPPFR